jgi:DNA-binding transcriptional ArsR family regulator
MSDKFRDDAPWPRACAPVFAALSDATRLAIISKLSGGGQPLSITQLTAGSELTRQGMSKHLRVLENAGLVSSIRVGRECRYAFTPEPIRELRDYLERVSAQWDDTLSRLKDFVEKG